ncbi:MAG: phosphotransferase [Chloroflexi bacterium]|nr:phosphotransferase [Chloroflexota bacterium]
MEALAGGVSSEIWRIDLPDGPICVKRALARLRVAGDWQAPVERNRYEWAWLETAAGIVPRAAPRLIAHAPDAGMFAMEYLDPATYPVWKTQLRDGIAERATAVAVAEALAAIHSHTALNPNVAARFPTDDLFYALRLEPYFVAAGARHDDCRAALEALVAVTGGTHQCLVHGDVSPKNILAGPAGPVFLDAECAWYGDPAFDLAFCLNHLLLKCLWRPASTPAFLACYDALARTYLASVGWEAPEALELRAARLLPGLLLARVDGKSPVEYLVSEAERDFVRGLGRRYLLHPPKNLGTIREGWRVELHARWPEWRA